MQESNGSLVRETKSNEKQSYLFDRETLVWGIHQIPKRSQNIKNETNQ